MNRKPNSQNPPCPRCGATHVVKNGSKGGRPRWVCRNCGRSFGPTLGTAMYRLRVTPAEVARTLLVVMRRGSLSAAEEITATNMKPLADGSGWPPNTLRPSPRSWSTTCI